MTYPGSCRQHCPPRLRAPPEYRNQPRVEDAAGTLAVQRSSVIRQLRARELQKAPAHTSRGLLGRILGLPVCPHWSGMPPAGGGPRIGAGSVAYVARTRFEAVTYASHIPAYASPLPIVGSAALRTMSFAA